MSDNSTLDYVTISAVSSALEALEGNELKSYVPKEGGEVIEDSGVTIAKGLDIGRRTDAQIDALPIKEESKRKLKLLNMATGQDAADLLEEHGTVTLDEKEAEDLNKYIAEKEYNIAKDNYETYIGKDFDDLPANVRNALVVASFQLGAGLYKFESGNETDFARELKNENYEEAADNLATWNTSSGRGLQKRYRVHADLMRGLINLSDVPAAAARHLEDIDSGVFYDVQSDKYKNKFSDQLTTEEDELPDEPEQEISEQDEQAAPTQDTYTIQPGDNLTQISARLGVDMADLMRANSILNANEIQAGQELVMPVAANPQEEEEEDPLSRAIQDAYEAVQDTYNYSRSQLASFLSRL